MSQDNAPPPKVKVVDRRWFNEAGEVRPERAAEASQQPERTPERPASPPRDGGERPAPPREAPTGQAPATSQIFLELVATLAQQAEVLLAGAPGFPKQPEQARRLIDYLGVLERKTEGNLSAEEKQVLGNVVFQLRSMFVQMGR